MSRRTLILIVLGTLVLGIFLLKGPSSPTFEEPAPGETTRAPSRPSVPDLSATGSITRLPVPAEIAALYSAETNPEDDLAAVESLLYEFRRHNGENPIGDNGEITAALQGGNPKRLAYLPDQGPFLNAERQILDRWGTPLFFHALSADHMEIRSAGPDRQFNTGDDIVR